MTSEIIAATSDCEIVSLRIVNAPMEIVYSAWTDPEHLKNWWGQQVSPIHSKSLIYGQVGNGVLLCMGLTKEIIKTNASLLK